MAAVLAMDGSLRLIVDGRKQKILTDRGRDRPPAPAPTGIGWVPVHEVSVTAAGACQRCGGITRTRNNAAYPQ